jgi:hypothetical protein
MNHGPTEHEALDHFVRFSVPGRTTNNDILRAEQITDTFSHHCQTLRMLQSLIILSTNDAI